MERQRNAIHLAVLTNTDARRARCSRCSSRVRRGWKYGRVRTTRPLDTTRSRNRSKETGAASSIDHRGNRHRSTEQRHLHDATVPTLARNSVFLYGWLRCNHQQRHQRPHQPTHIRTKASPHAKTHFHTHLLLLHHPPRVRVFSRNKLSLSLNRTHRRPNTMTRHDRPTPPIPRFSPKHSVQSRGTCTTFQRCRSCRNDQTIADLRSKPMPTVRPCLRIVRMQMSCLYAPLTALVYKERLRRWPLLMKLGRYRGLVRFVVREKNVAIRASARSTCIRLWKMICRSYSIE